MSAASRVTSADIMRVLDQARGVERVRHEMEGLRNVEDLLKQLRIDPQHERALNTVRDECVRGVARLRQQRTALLAACGQYSLE